MRRNNVGDNLSEFQKAFAELTPAEHALLRAHFSQTINNNQAQMQTDRTRENDSDSDEMDTEHSSPSESPGM